MAKYPGLYERGGIWQVRKKVPVDLRHIGLGDQVRRSLGTSDKKAAVGLYPAMLMDIQALFDGHRHQLRNQDRVSVAMKAAKLEALTRQDIDMLLSAWWARRQSVRSSVPQDTEDMEAGLVEIRDDLDHLAHPSPGEGDPVANVAERLLVEAGMAARPRKAGRITTATKFPAVDRGTDQYAYLVQRVRTALEIEGHLAEDQILGGRTAPADVVFNSSGVASPRQPLERPAKPVLKDLIKAYRVEREALYGKDSTDRKYGLLFPVMEEVIGPELPVTEIRRDHCVAVLTFLQQLPPHATKRWPGLSLAGVAKKAQADGLPGLAPKTVGTYMNNLCAILRWAEKGEWGVKPNVEGLNKSRDAQVRRRGFEPDELGKLFATLEQFRLTQPTRYWVPALALYTGARAGELCQLIPDDILSLFEVPCVSISEFDSQGRRAPTKRLKTKASERDVPIHSDLIAAGFIQFVDGRRGEDRLFPDLKLGPSGGYSHGFSKWFARHLDELGLTDPDLVFHGFRHGFRDACREADIAQETAKALGGWSASSDFERYGKRERVMLLDRAMRKISFGGFKLTPLPSPEPTAAPPATGGNEGHP